MTDIAVRNQEARESIAPPTYSRWSLSQRVQYCKIAAGAAAILPKGYAGGTPDQIAAKLFIATETGDMLGLHPQAAINGIDVIEGNPTVSPQLALGLIRRAGHKVRIVESGSIEEGDLKVTVTVTRADDPDEPISKSFSIRDAERADLLQMTFDERQGIWKVSARSREGHAKPWEKYTADMCQWRAVGRVMRAGVSDIMLGVSYFPEELEALVDDTGSRAEVIDVDTEASLVAEFKTYDDKADMAAFYQKVTRAEQWTPGLRAAFDMHVATLTKDSRPSADVPKGAPGHTGDDDIDAPAPQPGEVDEHEPVDAEVIDDDGSPDEPATAAQAAAPVVIVESVEERQAREEAEFEARSAAEFAATTAGRSE